MTISVTKLLRFLFGVAVVLLPFNALPYFKGIFGEMSGEGAFYPLLLAVLIWITYKFFSGSKALYIPTDMTFYLAILLGLWILISGVSNLPDIISNSTKGRTGFEKFFLQYLIFIFTVLVAVFIYNVFRKDDTVLLYLRRSCFISFLIAGFYSSVEILFLLDFAWAGDILNIVNGIFRDNTSDSLLYFGRLRSVSGEASWFAMYLSFAMPWMLSYMLTEERKFPYVLLNTYLIALLILTMSRTAYVICGVQIILFCILFGKNLLIKHKSVFGYSVVGLIGIIMFLQNFSDTMMGDRNITDILLSLIDSENLSNVARFGSQLAAINMFLSNPIFGVGLGQYGFHMPDFMPGWAFTSIEIQFWASGSPDTPWPPVHGLYARILGELGLFGLLIWLFLWGRILLKLIRINKNLGYSDSIMLKSLFISIIGVLLSGFNTDSFRFFGYWILMGIAWCYTSFYDFSVTRENYEICSYFRKYEDMKWIKKDY